TAQKQLDDIADGWQKEIETRQQDLDRMYKDFDAEQVMRSDELKKKRKDQIALKEKAVLDLQRKRFGFEGDLFKKRQELVKPIHDIRMNMIKLFLLDIINTVTGGIAKTQKIGYIKIDNVVALMPETAKVDSMLNTFQADSSQPNFNYTLTEYQHNVSAVNDKD